MPYIKDLDRSRVNGKLYYLVQQVETPGDLNYIISQLVWSLFDRDPSYTKGNELIGVLEAAKLEFYRRKVAPYEDKKILENGDLNTL